MISRKYLKDYRVEDKISLGGQVRQAAVYIGKAHTLSPSVPERDKHLVFYLTVLSGLAYIAALIPVTYASRLIYVILPFVVSALPVFFMVGTAVALLRAKETMERKTAEMIANRLPPSSLFAAILTAASFLGLIINAAVLRPRLLTGDYIFGAFSFILFLASAAVFAKCRRIRAAAL